jgi:hypothetical protein
VKYILLLVRNDAEWEALSDAERDMPRIERWWMELAQQGVVLGGAQLWPARTATTIRWSGGSPVVHDGPFIEAKESVAGYGVIEVADLDAAIAIARTWPARGHAVEIRPLVPRE